MNDEFIPSTPAMPVSKAASQTTFRAVALLFVTLVAIGLGALDIMMGYRALAALDHQYELAERV